MKLLKTMETISELNTKWWYRLLKVVFVASLLISLLIAVVTPYFFYPKKVDLTQSVIRCDNGKVLDMSNYNVSGSYVPYNEASKIKYECLDADSGLNSEEVEIVEYAKANGKTREEAMQALSQYRTDRFNSEGVISMGDNYTFTVIYKDIEWLKIMFSILISSLTAIFIFELVRRCFYYIVLGSIRPKK